MSAANDSSVDHDLPLGQEKYYWLIDFRFLDVLLRYWSMKSPAPISAFFSDYHALADDAALLKRMLEIVLSYDIEADEKEMQTVSAQDIKIFTEARDYLIEHEKFEHIEGLEAVIMLMKIIRETMEMSEDAREEARTGLEEKPKFTRLDSFNTDSVLSDESLPYSPYQRKMRKTDWDSDLSFFTKELQVKIDQPLPVESSLPLVGAQPGLDIEVERSIYVLFSYDADQVDHRVSDVETLLSAKEKLRGREDFLEKESLDTMIKLLKLSETTNMNRRRAALRSAFRSSWIINVSRLYYSLMERVDEHNLGMEPTDDGDTDLISMIQAAHSFDVEEMDPATLPMRLKSLEEVRALLSTFGDFEVTDELDSFIKHMRKAMPKAIASTASSSSWGYRKNGWMLDLTYFIGTLNERIRAYNNHGSCVRTVDGSNKLTVIELLDDDISRMAGVLLSYDVEEIEFDNFPRCLEAVHKAKKDLQSEVNFRHMKELNGVMGYLEQAMETKKSEVAPAPGHEKNAWIQDHSRLLVLLGHRFHIWDDAAIRNVTDMATFDKALDSQISLVRSYGYEEMDLESMPERLRDMQESVDRLDGVMMWYQLEGIKSIIVTMEESSRNTQTRRI